MLRSLPVAEPDRLWRVGDTVRCCYTTGYAQNAWSMFPWEAYSFFRANTPAFEELTAFQVGNALLGVRRLGSAAPVVSANGQFVSGNFFATFRVPAWRGRLFSDADDREGAAPVAVMSFHAWQRTYGSDESVVGATYQINGRVFTIAGVAPPGFFGAKLVESGMPDIWLPLMKEPAIEGDTSRLESARTAWLDLIGRVRPGVEPKTIEAQLQVELREWLASHDADMTPQERAAMKSQTLHLTPGGAGVSLMRAQYEDALRLLLFAAVSVLLVACANVATLLLARGVRHRDQVAIRAALGASRARLVRGALAHSLVLATLGGVAGIGVAYAGTSLILRLAMRQSGAWIPVTAEPSAPVLLFALGVSMVTAVLFGSVPAWITSRADPIDALRGNNRTTAGHHHRAQKALVVAQAVASLVLLGAAAMLGQSLRNLEQQPLGFDLRDRYLVTMNTLLTGYTPARLVPMSAALEDRLRRIPGVRMASAVLYAPMSGLDWHHDIRVAGRGEPGPNDVRSSGWTRIAPGFFETLGVRVIRGRSITDEDGPDTRRVAVVNEAFAKTFFGGQDPIGQHFGPMLATNAGAYEIVGVVSNVRYFADVWTPIGPMYFVPEAQTTRFADASVEGREVWSHYPYNVIIWAPGQPRDLEAQVTKALAEFEIPLYDVRRYDAEVEANFSQQRMVATLGWVFGAASLLLAAVGLYGVTAYGVEQRTNEIGVRMALGADRRAVVSLVLRDALQQVAIGLALGIPAAIGVGRVIASQLFEVQPWDPLILTTASLLLVAAALVAAFVPVRRATAVDPMIALRAE
jgi:predicted permease